MIRLAILMLLALVGCDDDAPSPPDAGACFRPSHDAPCAGIDAGAPK